MEKVCLFFLLALSVVYQTLAQEKTIETWQEAIDNRQPVKAQKICLPQFWQNTGNQLFNNSLENQWRYSIIKTNIENNRATVKVKISAADSTIDNQIFLLEETKKGWQIAGITKSKHFADFYLKGKIDAQFSLEELDDHDDLKEFANRVLNARGDAKKEQEVIARYMNGFNADEIFERLGDLENVRLARAVYYEPVDRGVLSYTYTYKDKTYWLSFYLTRTFDNRWEIRDFDFNPPSLNNFLR